MPAFRPVVFRLPGHHFGGRGVGKSGRVSSAVAPVIGVKCRFSNGSGKFKRSLSGGSLPGEQAGLMIEAHLD